MDYPTRRRERLAESLLREGTDALLVSSPVSVTYLTGFSGDSSVLVLGREWALLVSDARYAEQVVEECPGLEAHIRPPTQKLPEAVAEVLNRLHCRCVGFESGAVTVAEFEQLRGLAPAVDWKGAADRVERLRQVKDPAEVEAIREAIAIAERAFTAFRALLQPHHREKDLCDALDGYIRQAGGRGSSFPPIVAVGERAALPHAPPTDRAVRSGELLLVDWGASGRFYKSDLTRVLDTRTKATFAPEAARGGAGAKLEEVYAVVLRARERALAAVRPGVPAREVDAAARSAIAEAGYGAFFGHGLGHGLGLEVHEAPAVRPLSDTPLEAGMVFTVEPGIYLPGWGGIRVEDDVLVTPDGCEVLTGVPRDLEALRPFA
jgi:Xaa-Pro aminopeptidase